MRSRPRALLDNFYHWLENSYRARNRVKKVKRRLKAMKGGCTEKDAIYKTDILPYWKKYGVKPSKIWHRLYGKPGVPYDVRYIPDDLWFNTILPYFSNMDFRRALEDKCLHNVQFPGLKRPETVVKCISGLYYDDDLNLLDEGQALQTLMHGEGEMLIKPSVDSGEGRLIKFFTAPLDEKAAREMLRYGGTNFIIQKALTQHPTLAQFNPGSVNTIRVMTFLFKGKAHLLSAALRIGTPGARVDNSSKGGLMCRINADGTMAPQAFDNDRHPYDRVGDATPFAQVTIPSFDKVVALAKELHLKKPHFKIIGWDWTVTPEGEPLMIEYNVCPGGNQMTCGPAFGDLTEEVLEEVFITKSLKGSQN